MFGRLLRRIRIGKKITILLILIFAGGVFLNGIALSTMLEQQAEHEVVSQAMLLIEMVNSVRQYTLEQVYPLLEKRLEDEGEFIPEAIPAFAAREAVAVLRRQPQYQSFFFKDAMLDPTNLRDKADDFETRLIERFRTEKDTPQIVGFRDLPGGKVFYLARPVVIHEQRCLRCHSSPGLAPKSQLATYDDKNGFSWKLNEVIGSHVVSVPASAIFAAAQRSFLVSIGILISIFAAVIWIINFILKCTIIKPIRQISRSAEAISTGQLDVEFKQTSEDEIGALVKSFNRMRTSLTISMKLLTQRDP